MKYWLGICPLCAVWAELGKNGPLGPSPSPSMLLGGEEGFLMEWLRSHMPSRSFHPPMPNAAATANESAIAAALPLRVDSRPPETIHCATRIAMPARETATCAYIHFHCGRAVPVSNRARPIAAARVMSIHPRFFLKLPGEKMRGNLGMRNGAARTPRPA